MIDQEYFTVHHAITVNIEPLANEFVLPSEEQFGEEVPAPFIIANEFSHLDHLSDMARAELRNNDFKQVIQLLDTQNSKLNLLLTYMLSQQDVPEFRYKTRSFGASQLTYTSTTPLQENSLVRVRMFLDDPAAAIYCYAHVCECVEVDDLFHISVRYDLMRDIDQDLIIKAALHQQQKLLRQRSIERDTK